MKRQKTSRSAYNMSLMEEALDESLLCNALEDKLRLYNRKIDSLNKKMVCFDEKLETISMEMSKMRETLQFFMETVMNVKPPKMEEDAKDGSSYIS